MARTEFTELPARVREQIARRVGAGIRHAQTQTGGFSADVASRVLLEDGQRIFVKASPQSAEGTFELFVREAEVLRMIPHELPAANPIDRQPPTPRTFLTP
ncbi:MAG: hypothetical protein QM607_08625 [Microbacterium sp.]